MSDYPWSPLNVIPTRDACLITWPAPAQQTLNVDPMLIYCWASVAHHGPALTQHWVDASCLLGGRSEYRWAGRLPDYIHGRQDSHLWKTRNDTITKYKLLGVKIQNERILWGNITPRYYFAILFTPSPTHGGQVFVKWPVLIYQIIAQCHIFQYFLLKLFLFKKCHVRRQYGAFTNKYQYILHLIKKTIFGVVSYVNMNENVNENA